MASTIQLKRGTGSAVPSGLSDGELAINLDNNKLYFGTGSAVKNDFHFNTISSSGNISGSLAGTVSAGSGSYHILQGDTTQDTSLYVDGTITGSSISSSGNIYATDFFDNGTNINTLYDLTPAGTYSSSLQELGNITSSNISSSGTIIARKFKAMGSEVVLEGGSITASGDISGSVSSNITIGGILTAGTVMGDNIGEIYGNYIYLTPTDFYANSQADLSRTPKGYIEANGNLVDGGGRLTHTAMQIIPNGYKAIAAIVYGIDATNDYRVHSSSIDSPTAGAAGSATSLNSAINLAGTPVTGGSGAYIMLSWEAGAGDKLYGARITLELA